MDVGGASSEILHFLHRSSISAAEQEQQLIQLPQPSTYFNENDSLSSIILFGNNDLGLEELITGRALKAEPDIENWCDEIFGRIPPGYGNGIELGKTSVIARTTSCPPPPQATELAAARGKGKATDNLSSKTGGERTFKKRKANNPTVVAEESPLEKKSKADEEKNKDSNSNNKSTINSQKESPKGKNPKDLEVAKRDYIHVRARRGHATDSHSLAERVRREKISAKMKYLQNLVPGCNKITGKAGMLDEIINYVQSLQRQVEFLSMKLTAITPSLDFGMNTYLSKEMFSPCGFSMPTMGGSLLGQGVSSSGLGMGVDALGTTLRRTISAPVCIPETCQNSSGLNQIQPLATNVELQNLYAMDLQQGRSVPFIADQPFVDFTQVGNVKLEEM